MISFEHFRLSHIINNLIEEGIVGCNDDFGCFFHNVEQVLANLGDAVRLMMSQFEKSKAKRSESIFLGQSWKGNHLPKFDTRIITSFLSDDAIVQDSQIANISIFSEISLHLRVHHNKQVRIVLRSISPSLQFSTRIEVLEMRLEPMLPTQVSHFHYLEFVVSVYSSKFGKILVQWMFEVM